MLRAIYHRDRRAPVSLARNTPVFQPISRLSPAESLGGRVDWHLLKRLLRSESGVGPRIDHAAVFGISLRHSIGAQRSAGRRLYDDLDGQIVLLGELVIALIMRGNRHYRAGSVFSKHEICDPDRHAFARKWI